MNYIKAKVLSEKENGLEIVLQDDSSSMGFISNYRLFSRIEPLKVNDSTYVTFLEQSSYHQLKSYKEILPYGKGDKIKLKFIKEHPDLNSNIFLNDEGIYINIPQKATDNDFIKLSLKENDEVNFIVEFFNYSDNQSIRWLVDSSFEEEKLPYNIGDKVKLRFVKEDQFSNTNIFENDEGQLIRIPKIVTYNSLFKLSLKEKDEINFIVDQFDDIEKESIRWLVDNNREEKFIDKDSFDIDPEIINTIFNNSYEYETHNILQKKMQEDYQNNKNVWTFTLLRLINLEIKISKTNSDFLKVEQYALVYSKIYKYISKSSFIAYFKETQNILADQHNKLLGAISATKIINSNNVEQNIEGLYKNIINEDNEINENLYISLIYILNNAGYLIQNNDLEKFCQKLFKLSFNDFDSFIFALLNRRKLIRKKLFNKSFITNYDYLINNPDLKHLSFLQQIDVDYLISEKNLPREVLSRASKLRYDAFYNDDIDKYNEKIYKAIDLLSNIDFYIPDYLEQKDQIYFFASLNIEIAMNYEALASRETKDSIIMKHLKLALSYYRRAKSKRGFFTESIIRYKTLAKKLNDPNITINEIRDFSQETLDKWISEDFKERMFIKHPSLEALNTIFSAFTYLGINSDESDDFLFKLSKEDTEFDKKILNRKRISKVILAYNTLSEISNENENLRQIIVQFIQEGEVNINSIFTEDTKSEDEKDSLLNILSEFESISLEFKGSYFFDYNRFINTGDKVLSDKVSHSTLKNIVAMMNVEGGNIILGVLEKDKFNNDETKKLVENFNAEIFEDKLVVGVESDLKLIGKDKQKASVDDYLLHLNDIINNAIGANTNISPYIKLEPYKHNDHHIVTITIKPLLKLSGVSLSTEKGEEFWWRESNRSVQKTMSEMMELLLRRKKS